VWRYSNSLSSEVVLHDSWARQGFAKNRRRLAEAAHEYSISNEISRDEGIEVAPEYP
jgi:hypothetical protein